MLNPLSQTCAVCGGTHAIESGVIQPNPGQTIFALPACPKCGAREFCAVLTLVDNPGEHASMIRELAAQLGLIQRTDPKYFPQG